MQRINLPLIALTAAATAIPLHAAGVEWEAFVIRDSNVGSVSPPITEDLDGNGVTTSITLAGQKTGYGTSYFDGQSVAAIPSFDYDRIDPGDKNPYLNLWVTDGSNYAVLAPFINASGTSTDVRGQTWTDLGVFIYETDFSDLDWIQAGAVRNGQTLEDGLGNRLTIGDISHLTIADPGSYGGGFIGTGPPKNGTGFNIIFGDTQANYVQDNNAFVIDNVSVPEPGSIALLGLSGLAMMARRRRRA